ncbi:MAG: ABC transporter permease [Acidobacteria bacterium]|nr:ABC transporter permease [Acidobacteriota bacterium]
MIRHSLREALLSLWRNRFMNLVASFTIAVSLLVLGLFLLLAHNLRSVVAAVGSQVTVSVYLRGDATEEQRDRLMDSLRGRAEIEGTEYLSPQAALEKFQRLFPTMREVAGELEENPLPASVEIRIAEGHRDPDSLRQLAEEMKRLPGVDDADFDLPWVTRLRDMVAMARAAGVSLGGVVGLAAILTIASVIRMTIYARQQEIEIMRLVGATRTYIAAPFLLESSLLGILGGVLSLGALYAIHRHLAASQGGLVPVLRDLLTTSFLPRSTSTLLLLLGLAAGALGGLLSLRKISL